MYQFTGFTQKANTALNVAIETAEKAGHTYVGTEHLLAGLSYDPGSVSGTVLINHRLPYATLLSSLERQIGSGVPTSLSEKDITPRLQKVIETALALAGKDGLNAGTGHLLSALLSDNRSLAVKVLRDAGIQPAALYSDVTAGLNGAAGLFLSGDTARKKNPMALLKYASALTAQARSGRLDPVVGREREIDRVIRILSRRTKNNPCLIGEPGVGKTAVVEGLAQRMVRGAVPAALRDKELYMLELTSMVAGAKYRGDFEERIRTVVNEVRAAGNIILFIDELHNLIGAGAAEGAVDAANILKPVLARGELRVIGATTIDEYRKTIEKDAALERRFQTVTVAEPTPDQTRVILQALRPAYEAHHGCSLPEETLSAAVELSARYLHNRFLPDKAIDLLDEAAAKKAISDAGTQPTDTVPQKRTVTPADVADIVSEQTGIPAARLSTEDKTQLLGLEEALNGDVIGQTAAVSTVVRAIRRSRTGLSDPRRPTGTFLFCGPTGVGKTQLAKALAARLFRDPGALISFPMSEFTEKHSVSRLFGAPPGYVGFEEGGRLTEQIRRHPYSVILFDEIEKAHPDVFNALLEMLEEGKLADANGKIANCRNCILVLTSNAGAEALGSALPQLGFAENEAQLRQQREAAVKDSLQKIFRPEFLNRIDETVIFQPLGKTELQKIAALLLAEVAARAAAGGVTLSFTPAVAAKLSDLCEAEHNGARPLRRLIMREIEDPLAAMLVEDAVSEGDRVAVEPADSTKSTFFFTVDKKGTD